MLDSHMQNWHLLIFDSGIHGLSAILQRFYQHVPHNCVPKLLGEKTSNKLFLTAVSLAMLQCEFSNEPYHPQPSARADALFLDMLFSTHPSPLTNTVIS